MNNISQLDELYIFGQDGVDKISKTKILISGINRLGIEILKNIILLGINSIIIHDVQVDNFDYLDHYVGNNDDNENIINSIINNLKLLNSKVDIDYYDSIDEQLISKQDLLILCNNYSIPELIRYNNLCRKYDTKFIFCNTFGLMGQIFCDFGSEFIINNNDDLKYGIINAIYYENNELIVITEDQHNLNVNDMIIINDNNFVINKIIDNYKFIVNNKNNNLEYGIQTNTYFKQIKQKERICFESLEESLINPKLLGFYNDKHDREQDLHSIFTSLYKYDNNRLPKCWSDEVNNLIEIINESNKILDGIFVRKICNILDSQISAIQSIIGSMVSQEIIKSSINKFTPINQWFYFESIDSIDRIIPKNITEYDNDNYNKYSKYNNQIRAFGREFQSKLNNTNILITESGSLGCEHLKNLSMMGFNKITMIGDNDDYSKLERYITKTNNLIDIISYEDINNNSDFANEINCIISSSNNIKNKSFINSLSINNKIPILESNITNLGGNNQCIIPNITELSKFETNDKSKSLLCTVTNFPYLIDHCIQYSEELYNDIFNIQINDFYDYINNKLDYDNLSLIDLNRIMNNINNIVDNIPKTYNDCLDYGYKLWYDNFYYQIEDLINNYPLDHITSDNTRFWSGSKKYPKLEHFNINNIDHINFVIITANLWSSIFNIDNDYNIDNVIEYIKESNIPMKIACDKKDYDRDEVINILSKKINDKNIIINKVKIDKKDSKYIEYLITITNIRSNIYDIENIEKYKMVVKIGEYNPTLITTISIVSNLTVLECIKAINNENEIEKYRNYRVSIREPVLSYDKPTPTSIININEQRFTTWDFFKFNDPTVEQVIEYFDDKYDIDIYSISVDQYMIISQFMNNDKYEKRLEMKIRDIYYEITGNKPINPFTLTIISDNDDDIDDFPLCYVYY